MQMDTEGRDPKRKKAKSVMNISKELSHSFTKRFYSFKYSSPLL